MLRLLPNAKFVISSIVLVMIIARSRKFSYTRNVYGNCPYRLRTNNVQLSCKPLNCRFYKAKAFDESQGQIQQFHEKHFGNILRKRRHKWKTKDKLQWFIINWLTFFLLSLNRSAEIPWNLNQIMLANVLRCDQINVIVFFSIFFSITIHFVVHCFFSVPFLFACCV